MKNAAFAALLSDMALLMELKGDNIFRVRAFRKATQTLEGHPEDIALMSRDKLLEIPGVGPGIADKAEEFVKSGAVKEYADLRKKFPEGLLKLLAVPGLGPKRAKMIFDELKIDSAEKLKKAAADGKLAGLPGFGEKLVEGILKGIHFAEESGKRLLLWDARSKMKAILSEVKGWPEASCWEPAGSLRRGRETVGDLDLLCAAKSSEEIITRFQKIPSVRRVLGAGGTKVSVLLDGDVQCDLRVVDPSCFGAALQYFTGSKEHNVLLRERAQKLGYTLNEYGLFRAGDKNHKKPVAAKTEIEIYGKLGLQFIPPELREGRGEIEAAEKNKLPRLVEEKDVKGCFHNHTAESDGADDLETMVAAARSKGWEWFVSADHSPSLTVARGLEPARLRRKMEKIKGLNSRSRDMEILCGSEVDILSGGKMDYADEWLSKLDVVVGSIHSGFKQSEEQITDRIVGAMENPHVDCIGHLTGRLLGKRDAYALNVDKILDAARRTGTALEINGQPDRQDLNDVQARAARDRGAPLAVNTDAHSKAQLDYMSVAVAVARRAWLQKEDVLNTKTWPELRAWLGEK